LQEAGIDQARFADPGASEQQDQPLGQHQLKQLVFLRVAPSEQLPLGVVVTERLHAWIASDCHGLWPT
jgi:hypothetical protein